MSNVKVYIKEDGRLMAVCPHSFVDCNVYVYCQTCELSCELAGKS
ncbi:MAG: hypothetical protein QW445_07400 [Candidatus Bathyarchaeia archaeon]